VIQGRTPTNRDGRTTVGEGATERLKYRDVRHEGLTSRERGTRGHRVRKKETGYSMSNQPEEKKRKKEGVRARSGPSYKKRGRGETGGYRRFTH